MVVYRDGAVGALMDLYEQSVHRYIGLLQSLSHQHYQAIMDAATEDADCVSAQSITNHVLQAGYGYANYIRRQFNDPLGAKKDKYDLPDTATAILELEKMMAYTLQTMEDKWNLSYEDVVTNQMKTAWGQQYDFEQLLEHAIVHVMRHQRQIERLLQNATTGK